MKVLLTICLYFFSSSLMAESDTQNKIDLSGNFLIRNFSETLSFKFSGAGENQTLAIQVSGEGEVRNCYYQVTRVSAPQQTRGLDGVIFARMLSSSPCTFNIPNKNLEKILNGIRVINIGYRIGVDLKIFGDIELLTFERPFYSNF